MKTGLENAAISASATKSFLTIAGYDSDDEVRVIELSSGEYDSDKKVDFIKSSGDDLDFEFN